MLEPVNELGVWNSAQCNFGRGSHPGGEVRYLPARPDIQACLNRADGGGTMPVSLKPLRERGLRNVSTTQ